jgi:hypothetical protein
MGLKVSSENCTVKIHLGDVGVRGRITLKLICDSCGRREMSPAGDRV